MTKWKHCLYGEYRLTLKEIKKCYKDLTKILLTTKYIYIRSPPQIEKISDFDNPEQCIYRLTCRYSIEE